MTNHIDDSGGEALRNIISGGTQQGPVLQGRDFRDIHFNVIQAAAAPTALAQLPALVAGFTGRETELNEITELLDPARSGGVVVVSAVAGLAGVGKTALAIQAGYAAREAGWFPGGVLFIDLRGYNQAPLLPGSALDALLRALGVSGEHIPPSVEERAGLYRSLLAKISEPMLVIADNASSEEQVHSLLPGPGPHRVIVTSRHTLAGLGARLLDVTVLDDRAGVVLLDTVLRAARPDDDRVSNDPAMAGRLARLCDGLPLALRIVVALLTADPSLTTAELADQLADELHRLENLQYDDGSGTSARSVAAAFELSYQKLDERAGRLFRLLPVLPGADLSSAAAAAAAGWSRVGTRQVISRLVQAHLVEAAAGAAGPWRMHDLLRLYARQLSDACADTDGRDAALDRLLDYYMQGADAADEHLGALPGTPVPAMFTGRADALAWLDAERPSLIAAVGLAASTGNDQTAMVLPLSLSDYLLWRRRFDDSLTVLAISRDSARRHGSRVNEGAALNNLGVVLREMRRFDEAIPAYEQDLAICRETGDRHSEARTLANLGLALQEARRFDEAITACQDAAAIMRETQDRHGEGMALNNLSTTLVQLGRFDEAIPAYQDVAAIMRDTRDLHNEAAALNNIGFALSLARRFNEAIIAHQDAAAIMRETQDRHREGTALNSIGVALMAMHRFKEAITAYQNAAAIYRETGDRYNEGVTLRNLGGALVRARRFKEAIITHLAATTMLRETRDPHVHVHESLVWVSRAVKEPDT
jgi:tetratricopeptide (TPR) repeat protein